MTEPSIYIKIIFFILLYSIIKNGYWSGLKDEFVVLNKKYYYSGILILLVSMFSLLFIDLPLSNYFSHSNKLDFIEPFIKIINSFGNGNILFTTLTVIIVILHLLNWDKYARIFSVALSSSVLAGIINVFFKMLITRERPYVNLSPDKFLAYSEAIKQGKLFQVDYLSMPSGHTIIIFGAMVPLIIYFKSRVIKFLLFLLPILVGLSRVYLFKHWLSDVIIAGYLGTIIGVVTYKINIDKIN